MKRTLMRWLLVGVVSFMILSMLIVYSMPSLGVTLP